MGANNSSSCNIGVGEAKQHIAINSAFAVLGTLASASAILLVLVTRAYRVYVYRLTLYLAITSLCSALALGFAVLPIDLDTTPILLKDGWNATCTSLGYLNQYFAFSSILASFWICLNIFAVAIFGVKLGHRLDYVGPVVVFILPLLVSWVPFIDNAFGPTGVWCWIKDRCSMSVADVIKFQFGASFGPFAVLYLSSLFLIAVIILRFCAGSLCDRGYLQQKKWAALKEVMPLLVYPTACSLVSVTAVLTIIIFGAMKPNMDGSVATLWVISSLQVAKVFIPLSFLLHPSVRRKLASRIHTFQKDKNSLFSTTSTGVNTAATSKYEQDSLLSSRKN